MLLIEKTKYFFTIDYLPLKIEENRKKFNWLEHNCTRFLKI